MGNFDSVLNPANLRAKISGKPNIAGNDDGAMLVEAMIYFVIVVLIAAQIIPELMKSLEKAEVDNMRAAVTTLSNDIQVDHAYTGVIQFTTAELNAALSKAKKSEGLTITASAVTKDNAATTPKGVGYVLIAESSNSANYCVRYSSQGFVKGTGTAKTYSQFEVKAKGSCNFTN